MKVDTREYIDMLLELVGQGRTCALRLSGGSMTPFLVGERDSVMLKPMRRKPRKGDIVLFQRTNGAYVVHRVCRVDGDSYYIIGDAQIDIEGPVALSQIRCIVESVNRKGRWIGPEDFWWKFFAGPWLKVIPLRWTIVSLYGKLRRG